MHPIDVIKYTVCNIEIETARKHAYEIGNKIKEDGNLKMAKQISKVVEQNATNIFVDRKSLTMCSCCIIIDSDACIKSPIPFDFSDQIAQDTMKIMCYMRVAKAFPHRATLRQSC